uniref:STAS domain-containing protein n=1 Tax=Meloidogyne floridensis TaxID=298350 RepID=A0A915P4D5_9BILA
MCSLISSLFPVFPFGASLSRSALCEITGAKTQFHALFSSALLLVVILWIGPLLEPLPIAVLGCIVVVSLKPLFLQFKELPKLWKINLFDFLIWIIAFTTTAFLNITFGLLISLFFSILSIILKEQWPKFSRIGGDNEAEGVFRPLNLYNALSDPGIQINAQIWRFESPLHFGNASKLVDSVAEIGQKILKNSSSIGNYDNVKILNKFSDTGEEKKSISKDLELNNIGNINSNNSTSSSSSLSLKQSTIKGILILDCSVISHIDAAGIDSLIEIYLDTERLNILIKFAAFSGIKKLSGLLQVASEILTDQTTTNNIDFSSAFEQRQREHLLVLTGLPESTETQPMARAESDSKVVRQILNELQIDRCLPSAVFRLGKQRQPGSKPRPLKILFPCSAAVTEALRNKKKLVGKFKNIVVRKSLTKQELDERSKLIELCKQKRESTNLDYIIYAGISPFDHCHTQTVTTSNRVSCNLSLKSPNIRNMASQPYISSAKLFKNLTCLYYNCRSVRNKINELDIQIVDYNPDLVLLTETWLEENDAHLNQLNSSRNFHILIDNRDIKFKCKGGGVAMLIRIEIIAVDLSIHPIKASIRLILVYRPPAITSSLTIKLLKILQSLCEGNVIIVGDFNFNANNINWNDNTAFTKCAKEFLEFTNNFNLNNVITSPTHNKGSILDLLLTNNLNSICSCQVGPEFKKSNCGLEEYINVSKTIKHLVNSFKSQRIKSIVTNVTS